MFKDKVILVTGGTGSIGSEIVRQLLKYEPKAIRIFSRGEEKQFYMQQELKKYSNIRFLIGDVRDNARINYATKDVDIVFHAAAMKHVPASEYNPMEAVKTNVFGTQNVIEAAILNDVERFVAISTDKVVNPQNTMGATKLLSEKIVVASNLYKGNIRTIFSCVRFGNVMGSSGSVIPLFINQIRNGEDITITDKKMSRFMMSIPQAAQLVLTAAQTSKYGETYVLKMPAINIYSMAQYLINDYNENHPNKYKGSIKEVGIRPGEKLYEELMTSDEIEYAQENESLYMIPNDKEKEYNEFRASSLKNYSSENTRLMSEIEFIETLRKNKILKW
ncbi:UDP-N-acetylglucosamine 4,6-dehydratase family protein [Enterococcus gallinarum]|uniref:UDP-N-acetylglucosamine 4,6-dehydratase family protein n=1 Tax=Enterococcus gallinarum TaxID=1353 RepID=UPI002433CA8F|nr:polysaccharide biosynthesis protein [Enterococcus gallinarum]MDL4908499.1 polysaccharide biosynthesis protein [Enterococcus gallinarum]